MKKFMSILAAAAGLGLFAEPSLPLSFDLGVHPEAQGTLTRARIEWRWSERLSSRAVLSYSTENSSGDLEGYGEDSLYAVSTADGSYALEPFVLGGKLAFLGWELGAGLGLKTESLEERGSYQNVGTQVFKNVVGSWRIGTPLSGALSARFGPVNLDLDLVVWPASLYVLDQSLISSLIAPTGSLKSLCFIGPEILQDLHVSVFDWVWAGMHYEFLWLSVPRLVPNELGEAWTSVIEGKTNQIIRLVGGLRVPLPTGAVEIGLGWRRVSSAIDGGDEAELKDGLVFEATLSSGM
jgi:hypothetical protein